MTLKSNPGTRRFGSCCVVLICGLWLAGCKESGDGLDVYRVTNNQAGHEFVKTEQFLVPVGSVITIPSLAFSPGVSRLSPTQERIVQQVFNSLEEITENTVGDTNTARVAEYKKMQFEIRGYSDNSGAPETDTALAAARAKTVMNRLAHLGTPRWRLTVKAMPAEQERKSMVVFVRTH
jgi:outer membrane protein OmpA-like peptidoglycan-associated protein